MSFVKVLFTGVVIVFSVIGVVAITKKDKKTEHVSLQDKVVPSSPVKTIKENNITVTAQAAETNFPSIDRVFQLFTTGPSKLPIVETIEYSSSTSWLKGRPAWLSDYAAYYGTSRHFIARSLNNSLDYFSQKIAAGDRFNVFKKDKKIEFHLALDISRLQLAFYYLDLDTHERVLLKVYPVGLGRLDQTKPSGIATPLGTYQLGEKVAVYKPGVMGFFHDKKTEMIQVFGSRWIPLGEEIKDCSEPSRGYGIHGAPWSVDSSTGHLVENTACIGKYESDGSIRLLAKDIEELYAIVITKPTFIHISKDFHDITLPGVEVAAPSR
ncbi:MAG: L,D-transpeptidase [Verrucomicrobia bacterium]|nr:L,D-transpeptidase [Verrucomicrobiota bacterium]